jgi:hypothetical protein
MSLDLLALSVRAHIEALRAAVRARHPEPESGASTLEMVIITLGLIAVAGLLVAALTAAVTSRTEQIR